MNEEPFSETSTRRSPLVYLITSGETTAANFPEKSRSLLKLVETAVELKIDLLQIREKGLPARLVFGLIAAAVAIARNTSTKLLVNDRADIALAAGADGVHLTSASLPTAVVRENFPPPFVIGVSTHTFSEAEAARRSGADFAAFSPIYETPSKKNYGFPPQGLEKLKAACNGLKPFPVIALGGIDETNYRQVLEAGASGFAAIRFLNEAENLRKLTAELGKG